jgi:hypothetical protein
MMSTALMHFQIFKVLLENGVSRRSRSLHSGSKQNTWMGWGSFIEGKEEEELRSFGRSFLYHLELRGGERIYHHLAFLTCGLGELLSQEGSSPRLSITWLASNTFHKHQLTFWPLSPDRWQHYVVFHAVIYDWSITNLSL